MPVLIHPLSYSLKLTCMIAAYAMLPGLLVPRTSSLVRDALNFGIHLTTFSNVKLAVVQ